MGSHTYYSPEYWAQNYRDFLTRKPQNNYLHKTLGYIFANIKHQGDSVTFEYLNKKFAVQFIKTDPNKAQIALEVKINNEWEKIVEGVFKSERNKNGKIRDSTYKPITDKVIQGFKNLKLNSE